MGQHEDRGIGGPDAGIRQQAEQLLESLPREADRQVISDLLVVWDRTAQELTETEAAVLEMTNGANDWADRAEAAEAALAQAQADLKAERANTNEWREKTHSAWTAKEARDREAEFHTTKLEQAAAWAANHAREAEQAVARLTAQLQELIQDWRLAGDALGKETGDATEDLARAGGSSAFIVAANKLEGALTAALAPHPETGETI